jgi:multiple sugar transport system permease protein
MTATITTTHPITANVKKTVRRRIDWQKQGLAYLFLLPALIVFSLVIWYPILNTILYSFQKVNINGFQAWVGLSNYVRMFGNPLFYTAWQNILVYIVLSLLMGFMVPLILALIINEMRGQSSFFQTIVYMPTLIPIAVALIVWRQIYAPSGGILNSLLGMAHLPSQLWLQDPVLAKPALIIVMTWVGAGGATLLYLYALREIPTDLFEAAELDGFSVLQRIWYIVIPLLRSRIQIMLVIQIIAVAQVFTEPFILTKGGPVNSTMSPVMQIYDAAFTRYDFGLASAWGVSMLVALSLFSILYVVFTREDISKG